MDMGEGSSTEDLVPKQALAPWAAMPAVPRLWAVGPSDQAARRGPASSSRAQGKEPTIQVELMAPAKTNKELAHWLQVEELAVEEAHQGRDVATFEVVKEPPSVRIKAVPCPGKVLACVQLYHIVTGNCTTIQHRQCTKCSATGSC